MCVPPDETTASRALKKFLMIHRHLRQYSRQMDEHGIRGRQVAVLRFLMANGPATVTQIQEHLYTSPSTASTLISQLVESGYAKRTRSTDDNRVVIVDITPNGQTLAEGTPIGGIGLLRRRLPSLPEERLKLIDDALAEIMQLMEVSDTE